MTKLAPGMNFTNKWFDVSARAVWDEVVPKANPSKVLEIGSFEGASACYLIERCTADLELHCIDTWEGAVEHKRDKTNMSEVEQRFHSNTSIAIAAASRPIKLIPHKGRSDDQLARLLCHGFRSYFDMIYIDGSHFANDALSDAVLCFPLLKVGGLMLFDDYLWRGGAGDTDPMFGPKLGVDAFLNVFFHKMRLAWSTNAQVVAKKLAD
jgi:predicted O-methyltransferase YrrM